MLETALIISVVLASGTIWYSYKAFPTDSLKPSIDSVDKDVSAAASRGVENMAVADGIVTERPGQDADLQRGRILSSFRSFAEILGNAEELENRRLYLRYALNAYREALMDPNAELNLYHPHEEAHRIAEVYEKFGKEAERIQERLFVVTLKLIEHQMKRFSGGHRRRVFLGIHQNEIQEKFSKDIGEIRSADTDGKPSEAKSESLTDIEKSIASAIHKSQSEWKELDDLVRRIEEAELGPKRH